MVEIPLQKMAGSETIHKDALAFWINTEHKGKFNKLNTLQLNYIFNRALVALQLSENVGSSAVK